MRTDPTRSIRRLGALAIACALLAPAAPAGASTTQESILQDDPQILGATPAQLDERFALLRSIGVDRVRVSVLWHNIAPEPNSQQKPAFPAPGPTHPKAYPTNVWRPYDDIVLAARRQGLALLFTLTGPGPAWATPGTHEREGLFKPDPGDFREFATAVGTRYSGTYPVDDRFPDPEADAAPIRLGPIEIGGRVPEDPAPPLPRVDTWSIWNEPNYPSWLRPIWRENRPKRARDMVAVAPHHYRRLVDAAWAGLGASGHGRDRILIGETSPRGAKNPRDLGDAMAPIEFARELYCLRANLRPYAGRAAKLRHCPVGRRQRRAFRGAHPALFATAGFAHHPYSLGRRRWRLPTWRHPRKDNAPIANIGRLVRTLDRATARWGSRTRMPVWITEYGYQTKPPDPLVGVAPRRQGPLSAWGEEIAYRNPRVASIAQFLFVDDGPVPGLSGNDPRRWITWQSGLYDLDRNPKPALRDYTRPIHTRQQGRRVRVFGGYRPPATGVPISASVEYSPAGRRGWRTLRRLTVRNRRGYVTTFVRVRRAGRLRIVWRDPGNGARVGSRSVRVR